MSAKTPSLEQALKKLAKNCFFHYDLSNETMTALQQRKQKINEAIKKKIPSQDLRKLLNFEHEGLCTSLIFHLLQYHFENVDAKHSKSKCETCKSILGGTYNNKR